MKKLFALSLVLVLALSMVGCSREAAPEEVGEAPPQYMVMVDGAVYHKTRHQVTYVGWECTPEYWDGEITTQVGEDEVPTENDQSNFATGIGYRYGEQEGTIVVIDTQNYKCWLYATEEAMETVDLSKPLLADPWGITMEVSHVTPVSLTLVVSQDGTELPDEPSFGAVFAVEKLEDGNWTEVPHLRDEPVAWNDVAYIVPIGGSTRAQTEWWEHMYGELPAGEYRIVKKISVAEDINTIEWRTYYAEFTMEDAKYEKVSSLGKVEGVDVNTLVNFDGAVYAQSYAVIDYAPGDNMLWENVRMVTDSNLVPYWHCETNSEALMRATICECNGESLILHDIAGNGDYLLFEKVK